MARRGSILVAAALGALATMLVGGIAWAAIPGAGGVIQGCYKSNNGQLRVVDAASDCYPSELAINWNQQGPQGLQGPKGDKGDKGDQGIQGIQGPKGDQGIQGVQGPKGDQGTQGIQGVKGDKGDQGNQGIQGPKGDKGDTGQQGPPGSSVGEIRWAYVNSDGTYRATSANWGAGNMTNDSCCYYVDMNRDITNCAITATPEDRFEASAQIGGNANITHRFFVSIFKGYDLLGAPSLTDGAFSVAIFCP